MKKIKERFSNAYANAQTMDSSQKKLNSLIMKLTFKKIIPHLSIMIICTLIGNFLEFNPLALLSVNAIIAIIAFKTIKKTSKEFNNFLPYQGTIVSISNDNKKCTIVLKQGKRPIKIEINYLTSDFKKLKINDSIKIGYNKDKKIATLYK